MSLPALSTPRALPILIGAGLSLALAGPSHAAYQADEDARAIAFIGVNVVPMDSERVLENHTVIVRDGEIVSVDPADEADLPDGAETIDGEGRWLMPGLSEMHGHVPGPNDPQYAENVLFLYVSNGVTLVRNMAGHPYHLEMRDRIEAGDLLGPTLYAASPWMHGGIAGDPETAREAARDFHEQGFDLIKMGGISREAYEAMAQTAHEIGIEFAGHIPIDVGLVGALDARQASIDHYDRYAEFLVPEEADTGWLDPGFFGSGWIHLVDRDRIPEAVERTIEAGTWNVPTLSLVEHLASDESGESMIEWPEMRYMPREVLEGWVNSKAEFGEREDFQPEAANDLVELRRELTLALHEAGAPIALGSDAPQFFNVPGFSIHHEMRMMEDAGLTPYEVLATGTRAPADYFDEAGNFGTVEPGRRADLILLEANPLDDLANVQRRAGVMVRGQWLAEADIQTRLDEIADHVASR